MPHNSKYINAQEELLDTTLTTLITKLQYFKPVTTKFVLHTVRSGSTIPEAVIKFTGLPIEKSHSLKIICHAENLAREEDEVLRVAYDAAYHRLASSYPTKWLVLFGCEQGLYETIKLALPKYCRCFRTMDGAIEAFNAYYWSIINKEKQKQEFIKMMETPMKINIPIKDELEDLYEFFGEDND